MRIISTFCFTVLFAFALFAHDGNFLAIKNVNISSLGNQIVYDFDIENKLKIPFVDVEIEFLVNGNVIEVIEYANLGEEELYSDRFIIPKKMINIDDDVVEIEVAKILGQEYHWASWTNEDDAGENLRQGNNVGSYEIYGDAPYRMKINDASGSANTVPIALILHDGVPLEYILDLNPVTPVFPWLEYVDIYIKKSSESNFGAPITFNDLSDTAFSNLFTTKSVENTVLKQKAFDQSIAEKDANHTIVFKEAYNANLDLNYTNLFYYLWYATINIPSSVLSSKGFTDSDQLDVRVKFSMWEFDVNTRKNVNYSTYLRIFREKETLPKLPSWYRGDTHLHTIYSENIGEFGSPLSPTKEAAKSIGIDWITTTDHTSDLDNFGSRKIQENWQAQLDEIVALNNEDQSMIYIRAQEASLNNAERKIVHFLGYPSPDDPLSGVFLGDGGGDRPLVSNTSRWVTTALNDLTATGGFAYGAHPFATEDDLGFLVGGGLWNLGDRDFPVNGQQFNNALGEVSCNNPSVGSDLYSKEDNQLVKESLKGTQIWNVRNALAVADNPHDPYNISGNVTPFMPVPEDEIESHINRFRQGQEITNFVNIKGLKMKNGNPDLTNWKLYYAGGSDAHGAFNFSNTSHVSTSILGIGNLGGNVDDNAVGRINTLTYCPNGMGANGENVLRALQNGNTTISDGPIMVQGVSTNGENAENEVMMGEDVVISVEDSAAAFVNMQYVTTPEFGNVVEIITIMGTENGEFSLAQPAANFAALENQFSYSISNLIEQFSQNDTTGTITTSNLVNKYFYIRHELKTTVNYGSNSPRIHETDHYRSFTNPVWIKIEDPTLTPIFENKELERATTIYPNPVKEVLHVITNVILDEVIIYDLNGKALRAEMIDNAIDVSMLQGGTYFLEIRKGNGVARKKFVIAK